VPEDIALAYLEFLFLIFFLIGMYESVYMIVCVSVFARVCLNYFVYVCVCFLRLRLYVVV
jgi:hypothetical protein